MAYGPNGRRRRRCRVQTRPRAVRHGSYEEGGDWSRILSRLECTFLPRPLSPFLSPLEEKKRKEEETEDDTVVDTPTKQVSTDAQILQIIRESVSTVYHASATCAMGKPTDPNAVIDPSAKVIGVKSLRVVDASSFPFLPPVSNPSLQHSDEREALYSELTFVHCAI